MAGEYPFCSLDVRVRIKSIVPHAAFSLQDNTDITPLYLISAALRDDVTRPETCLRSNRDALVQIGTPRPDAQEVMSSLAETEASAGDIEEAHANPVTDHINWAAVMAVIGSYDPSQLTPTSLAHADLEVVHSGQAADDSAVMRYARDLEQSDPFSRVVVKSLDAIAIPRR
jgi:hypothetical protein